MHAPVANLHRALSGLRAPLTRALVLLSILAASPALGARLDGAPTSSLGMADAVSASAVGANALFFNPAGMTLLKQYVIEGNYVFTDSDKGHGLSAAAVDSKMNPVLGLGIAYTKMDSLVKDLDRTGTSLRGAVAGGHSSGGFGFHLGLGVNHGEIQVGAADLSPSEVQELSEAGEPIPAEDDVKYTSVDAGIILQLHPSFRLATVVRNIIETTQGDRPRQPDELPMEVGLGCSLGFHHFQFSFDADLDLESDPEKNIITYKAGTQFLMGGAAVVRAGYSSGGIDGHQRVGFGLGYVDNLVALDVGVRATVDVDTGFDTGVSLRYFLP